MLVQSPEKFSSVIRNFVIKNAFEIHKVSLIFQNFKK